MKIRVESRNVVLPLPQHHSVLNLLFYIAKTIPITFATYIVLPLLSVTSSWNGHVPYQSARVQVPTPLGVQLLASVHPRRHWWVAHVTGSLPPMQDTWITSQLPGFGSCGDGSLLNLCLSPCFSNKILLRC